MRSSVTAMAALAAALFVMTGTAIRADAGTGADCGDAQAVAGAGEATEIPAPFDAWIAVGCARGEQVLAPRGDGTTVRWLHRDTADGFALGVASLDPGAPARPGARFTGFSGRLATGPHRALLLEIWQRAWGGADVPATLIDTFQLDATADAGDGPFSIFLYNRADGPRWMIVCRDRCRQALAIDVLRGAELDARIAGQVRPTR